ncbi:hypothetical protein NDR87_13335 [Nocardia sp. CDC159]|uniref:Fe-S cluster assembly iron-binding protein IscA n=1 Tax=Nocardia pulmonis TaxID=2951408 RepID=A0A9X2IW53_9NOCA|nr:MULTISPECIES: hypothetical protein [Nocardia]MCM6774592.1 hypothetical protein [Nocardia pulmonis]MCM6787343.1 hypothetical protein [Nocardia sp. CDC159]
MLTPTALEAVRSLTATEGAPQDAGLRIFTADQTLQLAVAAAPAENDQILDAEGSRIFLDQQAAAFLDDKILDTGLDDDGQGAFVLAQQDPDAPTE